MAYVRRLAADWATLIDEWRRSGLNLPTFCQLHGLSRGTMQNWVYKPALKLAVEESRRQAQPAPSDPGLVDGPPPCEPSPAFLHGMWLSSTCLRKSLARICPPLSTSLPASVTASSSFSSIQFRQATRAACASALLCG